MKPQLTNTNIIEEIINKKNKMIKSIKNNDNIIFFNLLFILLIIFFILFLIFRYIDKKKNKLKDNE